MSRGFAAVGLLRPKFPANIGGVMRAAHAFGAKMIAVEGVRTPITSCQDTPKAWRHMPVLRVEDLLDACPVDAVPVAVDIVEGAKPLPDFCHPQRAFYIFGPEDGTLSGSLLERCRHRVVIPTHYCLNLAAAVNVVLYDRVAKAGGLRVEHAA